jgi:carbohydrate-selective porin OprB
LTDRELPGHFSAGYWRLDGAMTCYDGSSSSVSQGFYTVMEQGLWRSKSGDRDQNVAAFLQFGSASGNVSVFTQHLGGGVVWQSPRSSRPHDGVGFAATWARFPRQPTAGFDYDGELVAEAYYKLVFSRYVALVPDVQFMHHPAGLLKNPDIVAFTPRLVISF